VILSLNSNNKWIFVIKICHVFFELQTECLNIINFSFKVLKTKLLTLIKPDIKNLLSIDCAIFFIISLPLATLH
jgi:hypothetical protein